MELQETKTIKRLIKTLYPKVKFIITKDNLTANLQGKETGDCIIDNTGNWFELLKLAINFYNES